MVAQWKYKTVDEIADDISQHNVVGLVNIKGIPSKQFQQIRKNIGEDAKTRVTKNLLMKLAFKKSNIGGLDDYTCGSCGVIFTNHNPFKLRRLLDANKVTAPPKAGNTAPKDIVVPAGDTPFAPGPVIGDLQKVGIKAQIRGGKIVVTENSLVAKEGDIISGDLASVLARMDIKPMEIGLDLIGAYEKIEDGEDIIYGGDSLIIDDVKFREDIQTAYFGALNLAINARIYNSEMIPYLLQNASINAKNLAINAEVLNKETIPYLLSKAHFQMFSLASKIPDGCDDELNDMVSIQPKAEAAKVEKEGVDEKEAKGEKTEKEEKEEEGDAAAGLAGLFG